MWGLRRCRFAYWNGPYDLCVYILNDYICVVNILLEFSGDDVGEEEFLTVNNGAGFGDIVMGAIVLKIFGVGVGSLGNPSEWDEWRGACEALGEGYSTFDVRFESHSRGEVIRPACFQ